MDNHKLISLISHVGADFFTILEAAASYEEALSVLDKHFKKPTRFIYARHQLLSSAQKTGESTLYFVNTLKNLIQKCECKEANIAEHQQLLLRDALVSGIKLDIIRMRFLDLSDLEASLDNCKSLASAIELSSDCTKSFQSNKTSEATLVAAPSDGTIGAVKASPPKSGENNRGTRNIRKCCFCGLRNHPRWNCPAQKDVCHKCQKKGHWAAFCREQLSAMTT